MTDRLLRRTSLRKLELSEVRMILEGEQIEHDAMSDDDLRDMLNFCAELGRFAVSCVLRGERAA